MNKLNVALIQLLVTKNKSLNLQNSLEKIQWVKSTYKDVAVVALPECFNSPYGIQHFEQNAENIPEGPTSSMLSEAAKLAKVFIIGGTIPEICDNNLYNTCTVWNPEGKLVAKYRKMHLFDIDIPGKMTFKESEVLKPGNELVTFSINEWNIGLGICYDLRFEEIAKLYRLKGCNLLFYPGAFNMVTGPMHWKILQQGRAVDNQLFVCAISPARGTEGYISWAHSQCTDPWGTVISLGTEEGVLYQTLDLDECNKVRQNIPIYDQRRRDIYDTVYKK